MEHFYQEIEGWSTMEDQGALLDNILNKTNTSEKIKILEIGLYYGRCTAMWNVELINRGLDYEYIGVDHFLGSAEHDKDKKYYEETLRNLEPIIDKVKIIKNDSVSESKNYPNEYFDIVYIDASHEYEKVKEDIMAWLPKVKYGGVICGDDYVLGFPGVIQAVNEFFGNTVSVIGTQQWYVKKEKKTALVCIAKNEDDYIHEWIDYHKKLGFDDIFIYQNNWECSIVSPNVHSIKYDGKAKQLYAYNDFIKDYSCLYEWAAFFDVDEFLVLKKHDNIKDFLKEYNAYDSIAVNWVLFGDNGLNEVTNNHYSVLNRFTKRQIGVNPHIKSIVKLSENFMFIENPHCLYNISWVDSNFKVSYGPFNYEGDDNIIQLNHYFSKTRTEYVKKIEKGRADNTRTVRTFEEFDAHNFNDIYDFSALDFFNKKPKSALVEFIIPTYNRINPLRSILSSLMAQTDNDWLANVVIDDFYNQEIVNLINGFNTDKIYYTFTNKRCNDWGHSPRQLGKQMSSSKYVIMTGDDNYYVPRFVEEFKKATKDNPVMVYWDMVHSHPEPFEPDLFYQFISCKLEFRYIDIGSFATRLDVAKDTTLNTVSFFADFDFVKEIKEKYNENDFVKINKVLYVHN